MPRVPAARHALSALLAVLLALLAAAATAPPSGAVVVTDAGSVETRVASQDGDNLPPGDVAFPIGGEGMAKAQALAVAHWGTQPCNGQLELVWSKLEAQTNATASWKNPTDAWNNTGENFDCRIDLNTEAGFDFPKLCTVMAHEVGHLLGNQHADQPGLLMSPYYSTALPECEAGDPAPKQEQPETVEAVVVAKKAAARPRAARSSASPRPRSAVQRRVLAKKRKLAFRRCVRRMRASGRTWRCRRAGTRTVRLSRAGR